METEKESLRAQVRRLEAQVGSLTDDIAEIRQTLVRLTEQTDRPRPTETFALWNSRLNAGT